MIINNLNVFAKKIELLSELKLYTKICVEFLNKNPPIPPEEETNATPKPITKDEFLISALPMTRDISILRRAYDRLNQELSPSDDQEIRDCVYHDLANYGISLGYSQDEFLDLLKEKFFAHPFIQRIDQFLTTE